jgi:hypothetical protein
MSPSPDWHTTVDTLVKIDARSLAGVGHVFVESLRRARKGNLAEPFAGTAWGRRGIIARGAIIPVVGSYTEV